MRRVRIRPVASKNAVLHPGPNRATSTTPLLPRSSLFPPHPRVRAACQMVYKFYRIPKKNAQFFFHSIVGAPSLFPRFGSRLITRRFWTMFPKGPDPDPQNEKRGGLTKVGVWARSNLFLRRTQLHPFLAPVVPFDR
jgi:hypothetical protein